MVKREQLLLLKKARKWIHLQNNYYIICKEKKSHDKQDRGLTCNRVASYRLVPLSSRKSSSENQRGLPNRVGSMSRYLPHTHTQCKKEGKWKCWAPKREEWESLRLPRRKRTKTLKSKEQNDEKAVIDMTLFEHGATLRAQERLLKDSHRGDGQFKRNNHQYIVIWNSLTNLIISFHLEIKSNQIKFPADDGWA